MGKINNTRNYPLKTPVALTKLVGSDPVTGITHNYYVEALQDYILSNNEGRFVSVTSSEFGASTSNTPAENTAAFQACAEFCIENDKIMYIPYSNGEKFLYDTPIIPNRVKGLSLYVDAVIKNTTTGYDDGFNLNGVCIWAGCLTYPFQSKLEGLDSGKYLHRVGSIMYAGTREVSVTSTLYNQVDIDRVILLRSDLLTVDRTGNQINTAGERRYGIYDYSTLVKVRRKYVNVDGEYILEFERAIEATIVEPRILTFPDDQYVQEGSDLFIGPVQNLIVECGPNGGFETSGYQSVVQATSLYNFSFRNIYVEAAAGGMLCNSLNYGIIDGLFGNIQGSAFEIAFNSTNVVCRNIRPTVRGRADERNPSLTFDLDSVTYRLRNRGQGAINADGTIDYDYPAIWYSTVPSKRDALIFRKTEQDWVLLQSATPLYDGDDPVSLPLGDTIGTGWGDDPYMPVGSETVDGESVSFTKAISDGRSTINIHEGARNISLDNVEVVVSSDYDYVDQDMNIVGKNVTANNVRVYANRFTDFQSTEDSIEGDSLAIGVVIEEGDVPFDLQGVTVKDVKAQGRPVNNVVDVTECPLFPSRDTTSLRIAGSVAGLFAKLDRNYLLSGASADDLAVTRAADSTENVQDRYYAYYSDTFNAVMAFSLDGFAGKAKGWYMLPANSVPVDGNGKVIEPSVGGTLSGINVVDEVYDKDSAVEIPTNFGGGSKAIYLGTECTYNIYGPAAYFENASGDFLNFIPNNPARSFTDITFSNIRADMAALRAVYIRGGVGNTYENITVDRIIEDNFNKDNVADSRYLVDVNVTDSNYAANNVITNVKASNNTFGNLETVRDQGYGNTIRNIYDDRSASWRENNKRYFRQTETVLRDIFDFNPQAGVVKPQLNSRFDSSTAIPTFDTLNWAGGTSLREGYGFDIKIRGTAINAPNLRVNFGNPSSLDQIFDIALSSGDFDVSLSVVMLDRIGIDLSPTSPDRNDRFVGFSYDLKNNSVNETKSDISQVLVGGGTRQVSLVFSCNAGEQVDVYSYEVRSITNTDG